MQCVINTLHTPKEDKRMKKAFIIIILCMILQIFTVTVYANDSNVNIVSADNYESREFNQWKRANYNFSFNVSITVISKKSDMVLQLQLCMVQNCA